jgi:quinoprotein glucose dehydrogenase
VGSLERLAGVIRCGLRADLSPTLRELAWSAVSQWAKPAPRDPVHGLWRPVAARPLEQTLAALRDNWPRILESLQVDGTAVVVAAELGMPEAFSALPRVIDSESYPAALRARAVAALERADDATIARAVEAALASDQADVRMAARRLVVRRTPKRAAAVLREAVETATLPERQEAIQLLAELKTPEATRAIAAWMDRVERGACPPELMLDALDAAAASRNPELVARSAAYLERRAAEGPVAEYAMCLEGGDVKRGELIFATKQEVSCRRCHALKPGVSLIGPSLASVGAERTRVELLDSIVRPNEKITEGFRTTSLLVDTGLVVTGLLRREDAEHAVLVDAEGKEIVVEVATIEERLEGQSSMPEDLVKHMTRRELRDLVAYLATLRAAPLNAENSQAPGHGVESAEPPASEN